MPYIIVCLLADVICDTCLCVVCNFLTMELAHWIDWFEWGIAFNRWISKTISIKWNWISISISNLSSMSRAYLPSTSKIRNHFHWTHNQIISGILSLQMFVILFGFIQIMATKTMKMGYLRTKIKFEKHSLTGTCSINHLYGRRRSIYFWKKCSPNSNLLLYWTCESNGCEFIDFAIITFCMISTWIRKYFFGQFRL